MASVSETQVAVTVRVTGTVKWFDAMRGWGFIQPSDGTEDVFVHQQCIAMEGFRSLNDEEEVEYEVETDHNKRKRAVHVTGPGGARLKGSANKPRRREFDNNGGNQRQYDNSRQQERSYGSSSRRENYWRGGRRDGKDGRREDAPYRQNDYSARRDRGE